MLDPIRSFVVVGGGSAGLLSALTLRVRFKTQPITIVRSPELGIIGVGEGTFASVPKHLHGYLGIDPADYHRHTDTTWKLGTKFLWGRRESFVYTFDHQFDARIPGLSKSLGFFDAPGSLDRSPQAALMRMDKAFQRQPNGSPHIVHAHGYHIENERFVAYLETVARQRNIAFVDGTVEHVHRGEAGVDRLTLADGRTVAGDFYLDCSGFRSLLLGQTLGSPFRSFAGSLFVDRAVVGGWRRNPGELVKPYTTSETMNAGWCWQIEHPEKVIRGYVYASAFLSDDEAERELREKNPRVGDTRIVRFRSGFRPNGWVGNVVGIGNASGFVEPLEATALAMICSQAEALADVLHACDGQPNETHRKAVRGIFEDGWENVREFLALHYKFNDRLQTPFWRACASDVDLGELERVVNYYKANGPCLMLRSELERRQDQFGLEGYYSILVGLDVPYAYKPRIPAAEQAVHDRYRRESTRAAELGMTVAEAKQVISRPEWRWHPDFYAPFRPQ